MFHGLPGQQKSDDPKQSDDEVNAPHEELSASVGRNLIRLAFLRLMPRHFEVKS